MEHLIHNPNVLAALCSAGAIGVVVLIWLALLEHDNFKDRLKHISQHRSDLRDMERRQNKKMTRRAGLARVSMMKQIVQKLKMAQGQKIDALRLKLARAGYRSRDMIFVFLFSKLAAPAGLAFLAFFFIFVVPLFKVKALMGIVLVVAGGVLGFLLPDIMIKNQTQKREVILRRALPDALDLLVICAEAGLSLDASLDRVSREIGAGCPELGEEIGLTSVELSFLPERSKALQNLADRVPVQGAMALANTLIQTEKYGTPLAQALRILSAEMREERIMAAEAKAAKLPATLTIPMILFILPPLFVVLIGPAVLKVMNMTH